MVLLEVYIRHLEAALTELIQAYSSAGVQDRVEAERCLVLDLVSMLDEIDDVDPQLAALLPALQSAEAALGSRDTALRHMLRKTILMLGHVRVLAH